MSAVSRELKKEMLLRELAGIDSELKVMREKHQTVTRLLVELEDERNTISKEINKIDYPYLK